MTINATDIKLLEAEVMADTTDGGGRRTSRIIPDGVAGNIFPKISRLDSVYGRVNLRKVYGTVQTANIDTYAGSHVIITDAPDNAKIHCTLFSTASEFDDRTAARDRIESYVTSGPESRMILVGRQLPGQQSVLVYQRPEEPLPEIGEVYCLSNEPGSIVTTQQYIRIQDVDHEIRTFEDSQGTFSKRVITIDIGVALRYEFNGPETPSRLSSVARTSKFRTTTVVDAARYFGIKKLAVAANQNDLELVVESVYTPVVPTTNREAPISNESISESLSLVACGGAVTDTVSAGWPIGTTYYTRRAILPGSLSVSGSDSDDRLGSITSAGFLATVDYQAGAITRTGGSSGANGWALTYIPAASDSQPAHTTEIAVELNNRGTVYVVPLNPLPTPGTIIVDYRALGKWYRLRDAGNGILTGIDAAYGIGTVTYNTGNLVITLGALPDVDSSVIVSWGTPATYAVRAGGSSAAATVLRQSFVLPDLPVNPDSLSLTYTSGGATHAIVDNATGVLSGAGVTGIVNYTTGVVSLDYTTSMPDANTVVAAAYQQIVPTVPGNQVVRALSVSSAAVTNLGSPITPGSLVATLYFSGVGYKLNLYANLNVHDNGSGLLVCAAGQAISTTAGGGGITTADTTIGTVNYASGEVTINAAVPIKIMIWTPEGGYHWSPDTTNVVSIAAGPGNWGWKDSSASGSTVAKTFDTGFIAAPLKLDLTVSVADHIVPGSLMFTAGGKTMIDRNGTLYADVSTLSGAGIVAGTVDYASGTVSLSAWVNGAVLGLSILACLTAYGEADTTEVFLRTPGSPIRPGSFYVQATTTRGALISGASNDHGVISGAQVSGAVNQETGVVHLAFGQLVAASGNESEWWYNAANVVGGMIFKPAPVVPSSISFSCVVLSNLPLNADILGLDPVRLPMDGRVPIYRPADVAVIHNTSTTMLVNPVTPGTTYTVGRPNLAEARVFDTAGTELATNQYAVDLVLGTVTIAANFTNGTLVQPLHVKHRIEDMVLLSDVQINGQLTFDPPLTRDYPLNSFVSSALLFGDMNGRVTDVHDLQTFSAWSDTPGPGANSQYNNIDYPIEVLNNGAVTERWRINFTGQNAFQVIGENLGVIATGSTGVDCSPTNLLTGKPYFVIRAAGWGGGWSAGNQLRFNTISAAAPIWIARTVLPGATLAGDSFSMQVRGDVDAE